MNETDLKMYEFIKILREQAEGFEAEGNVGSIIWYGKADAYREIADNLEKEFRDNIFIK
jgi:hypothetical protein